MISKRGHISMSNGEGPMRTRPSRWSGDCRRTAASSQPRWEPQRCSPRLLSHDDPTASPSVQTVLGSPRPPRYDASLTPWLRRVLTHEGTRKETRACFRGAKKKGACTVWGQAFRVEAD